MKCRTSHLSPSRRGFVGVWFQIMFGSLNFSATAGAAWYLWRAQIELPRAEAELQAAGYSLDIVQACAPELPEAGHFGATPLLKGLATRDEDLTPEIKTWIEAITALSMNRGKKDQRLHMPEDSGEKPIPWAAWREWIAMGLQWEVPAEKEDAKAVLLAMRKKTAACLPPLLEAARTRKHSSFIPSQRARVAASLQRGDVFADFDFPGSRLMPLVRILGLQMDAAFAAGDAEEAFNLVTVLIALRGLHANDVSRINFLVRITIDRTLFDITQRNISFRRMNAHLLMQMQAVFAPDTTARDYERAMIMEVASSQYWMDQVAKPRGSLNAIQSLGKLLGLRELKGQQNPGSQRILKSVNDRSKAIRIRSFLDEMQALKSGGLLGYYRRTKELDDLPESGWLGWLQPHEMLAGSARRGYSGIMAGLIHFEMRRRMLLVACALERHRLVGGVAPDTLGALPKQLLPEIPLDLDGQPLRFRRKIDGWVLWSVGLDLKDDWNGRTPPPVEDPEKKASWKAADWQWQQ